MLTQRSKAVVDAIDIDADACLQAQENAESSLFAGRINDLSFRLGRFCTSQHASIWPDCIQPSLLRRFIEMPEPTTGTRPATPIRLTLEDLLQVQSQTACSTRTYCPYPALRPERSSYGLYSNTKIYFFRRKSPSSPYPMHNRNDCWPN
ncbi:MAG: hypothetical protein ACLRS8_10035 [Parabacteroides merdae]